jgi:hypothetical protein
LLAKGFTLARQVRSPTRLPRHHLFETPSFS